MSTSSGILLYKIQQGQPFYLLVRPGGPFYNGQEEGVWTIPKGIVQAGEEEETAARREFEEETGHLITQPLRLLGRVKIRKGKTVVVYAAKGDLDANTIVSNTFELEYPKHSGLYQTFPEIEKGAWYSFEEAKRVLHPKLFVFLEQLDQL